MHRNNRPMSQARRARGQVLRKAYAAAYDAIRGPDRAGGELYEVLAGAFAAVLAEMERNMPSSYFLSH